MLSLLYFSVVGSIFYSLFLKTPKPQEKTVISAQQAVNSHGQ